LAESDRDKTSPVHDSIAAAIILLVCIGVWWQTEAINPRSAMFPRLVAGVAAGLAVLYLLRSLYLLRRERDRPSFFLNLPRWLLSFALVGAYALLFPLVGFITSTLVFVPLMVIATGVRRPLFTAVVAVLFTVSSYGLFVVALRRYLPPELILQFFQ
jgi:hypothetical protein